MEIVDELDTPGCPNCAVKHLCAALACYLDVPRELRETPFSDTEVLLARAMINLVETNTGYASHKWFAIGLMERAEEFSTVISPERTLAIRTIRTDYMAGDADISETVSRLTHIVGTGMPVATAHLEEAKRELPDHEWDVVLDAYSIVVEIERIRNEYFVMSTVDVTAKKEERSQDMATKKPTAKKAAPAKKETPKAAPKCAAKQAACKGGKCAAKKGCKK